jgi:cytoplasmic iron level regulating protein YaaA (DUF328/UPF0246 family)
MLSLLSPAKSLDFSTKIPNVLGTDLIFESEVSEINKRLKVYGVSELMELMSISESLAVLNVERNQVFDLENDALERRAAIFAFDGDVYKGFDAYNMSVEQIKVAQNRLVILSGLYGALRPLDLILPYRLEMGTKMDVGTSKNLYAYWTEKVTSQINKIIESHAHKYVLNLASKEYAKVVNFKDLKTEVIDVDFKELRSGKLKVISFNAKRARGVMARQVVEKDIQSLTDLKRCDVEGYKFSEEGSTKNKLLFVKNE